MSVNPGFGGQSFIPSTLEKISQLKEIIEEDELDIRIEVDGGVKIDNIGAIRHAGADMFVAGSAIFNQDDYKATISSMRTALENALK
jgi:ribulose-phosphate 3-epimerase